VPCLPHTMSQINIEPQRRDEAPKIKSIPRIHLRASHAQELAGRVHSGQADTTQRQPHVWVSMSFA